MSYRAKTHSEAEKELLEMYEKADPDTQKAFIDALRGEKLNAADMMSMISGIMNDPNAAALFQSMKKVLGSAGNKGNNALNQLLAFTIFYSSSIYALLLCFIYWKWNFDDKKTEQAEQPEQPDDTEQ